MKSTLSAEEALDLGELYSESQSQLLRHVAKYVKCEEAAADIAHDSYLLLSKTAEQQALRHPRGLLFRIAANLAINYLRHRKMLAAKSHLLELDEDAEAAIPSAEHQASQEQRLELFVQIVDGLPPRCREAFILHKVHGLTLKEVAAELAISEGAVEKHISKGMKHCREQLLDRELS